MVLADLLIYEHSDVLLLSCRVGVTAEGALESRGEGKKTCLDIKEDAWLFSWHGNSFKIHPQIHPAHGNPTWTASTSVWKSSTLLGFICNRARVIGNYDTYLQFSMPLRSTWPQQRDCQEIQYLTQLNKSWRRLGLPARDYLWLDYHPWKFVENCRL